MIFPGFPGVLSFFQVFQVKWEPWFLSRGLCWGGQCPEGSLSGGVSVQRGLYPHMVKNGRYASYWNAILFSKHSQKLQESIPGGCVPSTFLILGGVPTPTPEYSPLEADPIPLQGSHSTWKTWKNESTPGKPGNIREFWKI